MHYRNPYLHMCCVEDKACLSPTSKYSESEWGRQTKAPDAHFWARPPSGQARLFFGFMIRQEADWCFH